MVATVHRIELIITDPAIRDGVPVLRGTHVSVADVVKLYDAQRGAVYAVAEQLRVPVDYIYAALAFFHANKDRIDFETDLRIENRGAEIDAIHLATPTERLRLLYRDLRAPLATLAGYLELIEKREDFGERQDEAIARVLVNAKDSLRYIRDIIANATNDEGRPSDP